MRISAYCFLLLLLLTSVQAIACGKENKIYISSSDVVISENGIFLNQANEFLPLKALYYDEYGFYFRKRDETADDRCPNQHKLWCLRCQGCAIPICKFRCKCVEWPFKIPE